VTYLLGERADYYFKEEIKSWFSLWGEILRGKKIRILSENTRAMSQESVSQSVSYALKMWTTGLPPTLVNLNLWGLLNYAFLNKCAFQSSASKNSAWEQCQIFSWKSRVQMCWRIYLLLPCIHWKIVLESTKRRSIHFYNNDSTDALFLIRI